MFSIGFGIRGLGLVMVVLLLKKHLYHSHHINYNINYFDKNEWGN